MEISTKSHFTLNDAQLESLYSFGYQRFKSGRYGEALSFFQVLHEVEPLSFRYAFAMAACYHQLQDYPNALVYYQLAGEYEPTNPEPYFHLYDCLLQLNNLASAYLALNEAILRASDQDKYSKIKEKAGLELSRLMKG